jgi:DNA-binding NarL/FixJ family response regulator
VNEKRNVIVLEDMHYPFIAIREELEGNHWRVIRALDRADLWRQVEYCENEQTSIDCFAIDLGFPPGMDKPFLAGIPLIEELRKKFSTHPILAYTGLPSTQDFPYDEAARQLLRLRVSFLYTRQMGEQVRFLDVLDWTWLGYVIISPEVADKLPVAILGRPDPLERKYWDLLHLYSQGLTRGEIAGEMGHVSMGSIKNWLAEIKERLIEAGELQPYEDQVEDLINWYYTHRVRYGRE